MSADWFRSPQWDAEAQEEFERRLSRARQYNRPQYLRIKGLSLNTAGEVGAARQLWQRVRDDPQASWFETASATEHLADSYRETDPSRAADLYRSVSELSPTMSGTSGTHHVKLAGLLLETGSASDLNEVGELLTWWIENARSPFPNAQFDWNVAYTRWALALGDRESAQGGAGRALDLSTRGPVFTRHPTVGIVHADEATLRWLRSVAMPRRSLWQQLRTSRRPPR